MFLVPPHPFIVSIPTSIVTGIRGYPQVSTQSTSEDLDDKEQYPLFARTVPSDVDNAVPIVKFFRSNLNATHVAVLHVNNAYGNAFVEDLKLTAIEHTPDLVFEDHQIAEEPTEEILKDTIAAIDVSKFAYIFAVLEDFMVDDVMTEAYNQGIVGDGFHNWFFSNSFGDIDDRLFEKDSPLYHAYKGVGRLQVSGGHPGMRSFDTFACSLRTLKSSTPDLTMLASTFPQKTYKDHDGNRLNYEEGSVPYLFDENFMDPVPKMADRTSPAYEAAIALGLSACNVVTKGLPLSGDNHFRELVTTSFRGVESDVAFHNYTGTRDPSTTLFAVENEVVGEHETIIGNTTYVQFHTTVSDIYQEGHWEHLEDYIFSDGTSMIRPDLMPPDDVIHHYIHTPLKIVAVTMALFVIAMAVRFMLWTERNQDKRVVKASQPLFLRIICVGAIIFASTIIPLNIDDRIASIQGCSIACNFDTWLLFLGFAVMFSALFTKTYRVNKIMNNPQKFRRVKVRVKDVIKPMAAIIGINFIILVVMTAVHPSEWETVVSDRDRFGRPTETYGHCTTKDQVWYYATLGIVNFAALVVSIMQAYQTRKLATEFAESRYIFYAMIGIVVALLQGIPVLVLVRDSPDVQDFIKCTVICITTCSVLLFMFVPKMKYLKKQADMTRSMRFKKSVKISGLGLGADSQTNNDYSHRNEDPTDAFDGPSTHSIPKLSGLSDNSGTNSSEEGMRFDAKTKNQLVEENKLLRQKAKKAHITLPTSLATDTSVSDSSSDPSEGIRIITRKSETELMRENKDLKKYIKLAIAQRLQKKERKSILMRLNNANTDMISESIMEAAEECKAEEEPVDEVHINSTLTEPSLLESELMSHSLIEPSLVEEIEDLEQGGQAGSDSTEETQNESEDTPPKDEAAPIQPRREDPPLPTRSITPPPSQGPGKAQQRRSVSFRLDGEVAKPLPQFPAKGGQGTTNA